MTMALNIRLMAVVKYSGNHMSQARLLLKEPYVLWDLNEEEFEQYHFQHRYKESKNIA